ncbi:hypothetical protein D9M72_480750 [compost metagenome]
MHGRAEILRIVADQRPVAAHQAAIGGVDTGMEIEDRAGDRGKGSDLQHAATDEEDDARVQRADVHQSVGVVDRGDRFDGN